MNKNFIDNIHKKILNGIKPDLTFILNVKMSTAIKRLKKRKQKNRYDKFPKTFYIKAQKAFMKLAKNKNKYCIMDSSKNTKDLENKILDIVLNKIKY